MSHYIVKEIIEFSDIHKIIIQIHRNEISQGFLSSLGNNALALLFSLAAESKFGQLYVAQKIESGRVVGFLLGTINTNAFYRDFLRRKSLKAVFILAPKLLSLKRIRKLFETLFYPHKKSIQTLPKPELLDVAVSKEFQGTGVAQMLFDEFLKKLHSIGIDEFKITTGEELIGAQRFYEKLGAKKVGEVEIHKGQKTLIYVYSIATKYGKK